MAKTIIWTKKAQEERKGILQYWRNRTKSNSYSYKLNNLIREQISLVAKHPKIGLLTDFEKVRVKIIKDYLLFYEEQEHQLIILTIWDSRRNPATLKLSQ